MGKVAQAGVGRGGYDENNPWTPEETERLRQMVMATGSGNWADKAKQLGTGRTGPAVDSHWRRNIKCDGDGTGGLAWYLRFATSLYGRSVANSPPWMRRGSGVEAT